MAYVANYTRRDVPIADGVDPFYHRIRASLSGGSFGGMACTSILVADHTGHVFHGRNLDWIHANVYQPLTTELTFTRKGKVVAMTTSFFPELSPTTAISPKVSFSYNARTIEKVNPMCLMNAHSMDPFQLEVRRRMLAGGDDGSFESLFNDFSTKANLCAPAYIALSGPGKDEGVLMTFPIEGRPVINRVSSATRARDGEEGDTRKPWFVVVANEDIHYGNAANWSARYNLTLRVLSQLDQDGLATMTAIDKDVLNVTGVRTDNTCYVAAMDVRNFKWNVVVRSDTVHEGDFHQDSDIPPEDESGNSLDDDLPLPPWAYIIIGVGCGVVACIIIVTVVCATSHSRRSSGPILKLLKRESAHATLEEGDIELWPDAVIGDVVSSDPPSPTSVHPEERGAVPPAKPPSQASESISEQSSEASSKSSDAKDSESSESSSSESSSSESSSTSS